MAGKDFMKVNEENNESKMKLASLKNMFIWVHGRSNDVWLVKILKRMNQTSLQKGAEW